MSKTAYTLLDNFEIQGIWWLPEQPSKQIHGTLSFNNEDKIALKLQGVLQDLAHIQNDIQEHPIILGVSSNGQFCTLLYNLRTQALLNFPGYTTSTFVSNYLFIGKHFNSLDEICLSSLQIRFTNLEKWLGSNPFNVEYLIGLKENRLLYKYPPEFIAKTENPCLEIKSSYDFSGQQNESEVIWRSMAFLKITDKEQQSLDWWWKIIHDLRNLLTLLVGEVCYLTHIRFLGDNNKTESEPRSREEFYIFFAHKKQKTGEIHWREMIITFPFISERISEVISLWLINADKLRSVYDLFFGTLYNPTLYSEMQLLSLTQAIESFHRVTIGGKYLSDAAWMSYKDRLTASIPAELDEGHKESLKNRIKYGNEYSLRKRINSLLETLDNETLSFLSLNKSFLRKLL